MTLREVFSSIANAIRSKTGKYDTIKPVDMATEIESIQTSGVFNRLPQVVDDTITTITADDLAGATKVRSYAFQYCSSLTSITLPDSVTSIGYYAFRNCSSLASITIPDSVTSISSNVFESCSALTELIIPNSVTSLGTEVFADCIKLVSITLPNNLNSIGDYYFNNCKSLTSITIPDNVTAIGLYAFYDCLALTELIIPANVTDIYAKALQIGSTTKKATITMKPTTPPTITSTTFTADKLNKIIVPAGCGDTYKSATNWSNFADYIEETTA